MDNRASSKSDAVNFLRKHLAPTLHNAVGTIIGAMVLASVAVIKPLRDAFTRIAFLAIPSWALLILCGSLTVLGLVLFRRQRRRATAVITQMQRGHADGLEVERRRAARLAEQLAQMTLDRDGAIKQKEAIMFRLQELSKRLGTVTSIQPASGAEKTRNPNS